VVGVPGADWLDRARQIERLGFDMLLVPDRPGLPSPLPALAAAGGATESLGIGPDVLAASLHVPAAAGRDCRALHGLFGDRFQPSAGAGLEPGTPSERRSRLDALVGAISEAVPSARLLIAASGRHGLSLAGKVAHTVALTAPPTAGEDDILRMVELLRDVSGERFDEIELNLNLAVVGEGVAPYLKSQGTSVEALIAAGAPAAVWGDADHMAEQLTRRRERLGVSYWSGPIASAELLAPVVALLRH
jgi:hypothetical protein